MAIICGRHVTVEAGTGLVHTAPAHGTDDYLIGKVYGLPVNNPVGDDGRFVAGTPALGVGELAGKSVWEANPLVLQELAANGHLLKAEKIQHSYPHCWRHKTPIIFRATTQWFIGMDHRHRPPASTPAAQPDEEEADPALVRRTRRRRNALLPELGSRAPRSDDATRPDWCVSRQRNWGVPLPFFLHRETGAPHPRTAELVEAVAQRVEKAGIEAWFALDARNCSAPKPTSTAR
ncbi:MAG: class I tRNA ligase family protein [Candidatus Accumulibacter necessarius]